MSWKAVPTQTNLVDLSPQHGEKERVVRVNLRSSFLSVHMSFSWMFFTHDCFRDCTLDLQIYLAIRIEATWRLFYVFCFTLSPYGSGVDQGLTLC